MSDFFSPWSCLSPNAETTAMDERSEFFSSRAIDARYAIPPAQISVPPSIPNFHELMTF